MEYNDEVKCHTRFYVLLRVSFRTYISVSWVAGCHKNLMHVNILKYYKIHFKSISGILWCIYLKDKTMIDDFDVKLTSIPSLSIIQNFMKFISRHPLFRLSTLCIARSVFKHPFKAKYIILHLTKCHLL